MDSQGTFRPPLANPNIRDGQAVFRTFAVRFWPYTAYQILLCLAAYGPFILAIGWVSSLPGFPKPPKELWLGIIAFCGVALLIQPVAALVMLPEAVRIGEEGVRIAMPGRREGGYLHWDDISRVSKSKRLWLPYLVLDRAGNSVLDSFFAFVNSENLWMPLYLREPKGVRAAILDFAPPSHPLRQYAENEW